MAILRTSLAWFALGVGLGRFQPKTQYHGCIRDLPHNEAQSSASTSVENPREEPFFHRIFQHAYSVAHVANTTTTGKKRREFNAQSWRHASTGGLDWNDRKFLGSVYRKAMSVFEYGLGESTLIADRVGVPRYSGIDSDPAWVRATSDRVASHFRFYLGDIGKTAEWGVPLQELGKAYLNYQLVSLEAEPEPFDVYFVDGRFRFACMMASFLHASARKAPEFDHTLVVVHDCHRKAYHKADHLLNLTYSSRSLCAFRRLPTTTDEQLYKLWTKHYSVPL